jgi:biotin-(acetyl-CoA carboxylase) ligase
LLRRLDYWYDIFLMQGGTPIRDAWLAACIHHGQALDIDTPAGRQKGWFAGLDNEGCLLLKNADSEIKRIHAGDVIRSLPRGS